MSDIAAALQKSRQMIEAELTKARTELVALDARREELQALIAQAEAILGGTQTSDAESKMTLHDALILVLRERGEEPMTARELADTVNERGLYRKRDGSPVEVNQVHARASNYEALFEKDGSMIRLRTLPPILASLPQDVTFFRDKDSEFSGWIDAHPDSYFINAERNPGPKYLVLHRSRCSHFTRNPGLQWTKDYVKICGDNRQSLEEWAAGAVGGEVTLCRTCFGS
jgi:hypothetical protein